ncbi:hypothetical protein [Brasilonema sp. UFV-L1]|uniref:hypothetical protein n=1 Tax=Brasilonema sp. UFV-L1 TaxID=2234130 RepID=UPI00145E9899|nr:hypothetical protein [Brasilonema sp. UFV-L1]NMG08664.1 hypothetical protein [Brasilonema sp. UFV-L1]
MLSNKTYVETEKLNQLSDAIKAATTFLLEAKDPQGWWQDFYLGRRPSDEWITAYVATALAALPDTRVRDIVMETWELFKSRCRPTGGWGFNVLIPEDADSTGWVLQLANAVGAGDSEFAQKARVFVREHLQPDGGMSTYASDKAIRAYLTESVQLFLKQVQQDQMNGAGNSELAQQFKVFVIKHLQPDSKVSIPVTDEAFQAGLSTPPCESFDGWCQSHVCVTAAIAALPEFRPLLCDYLINNQTSEGNWLAYWWTDSEYATALAAEALMAEDKLANQSRIDRAVSWGMKRLSPQGFVSNTEHPEGSPFATAWCLRLLLLDKMDEEVKAAKNAVMRWLLEQQGSNGAWISSAWLRAPHTHDTNPNQTAEWIYNGKFNGSVLTDRHQIFTTTTVMYSLQKMAEVLQK